MNSTVGGGSIYSLQGSAFRLLISASKLKLELFARTTDVIVREEGGRGNRLVAGSEFKLQLAVISSIERRRKLQLEL